MNRHDARTWLLHDLKLRRQLLLDGLGEVVRELVLVGGGYFGVVAGPKGDRSDQNLGVLRPLRIRVNVAQTGYGRSTAADGGAGESTRRLARCELGAHGVAKKRTSVLSALVADLDLLRRRAPRRHRGERESSQREA